MNWKVRRRHEQTFFCCLMGFVFLALGIGGESAGGIYAGAFWFLLALLSYLEVFDG